MSYNSNKISRAFAFAILALGVCNCNILAQTSVLQDGDLIFALGAPSPMTEAIACATDPQAQAPVIHVGIYAVVDGAPAVIEASTEHGVACTPWQDFVDEYSPSAGYGGVMAKRLPGINAADVVARAVSYLGRPYDWVYAPGDEALYCSELVYECYRDDSGAPLFTAAPMNFCGPDGTVPEFWTSLFASYGVPVPQGTPGTNPAAMAAHPGLLPIHISQ